MEEENKLKKEIEAILFAAGRMVDLDEIARLCKADKNSVEPLLKELKSDYERSDSPMFLIQEGNGWKMTVREKYLNVVKDVAPHTELNKALLETLAIVAWKQPVLQSDVVKIRGSISYEHIGALVEMGFLTKIKHGRSFVLKPSTRFFDYFDLPSKEAVKEVFKDIELSDSEKRKQLGEKSGDQQKKIDDTSGKDMKDAGEDGKVEVYNSQENKEEPLEKAEEAMETEKFGKLDVYEEKEQEKTEENQDAEEEEKENEDGKESDEESNEKSEDEEKGAEETEKEDGSEENEKKDEEDKENDKENDYGLSKRIKSISEKKRKLSKELNEFADIKEDDDQDDEDSKE